MATLADIVVEETSDSPAGNSETARKTLLEAIQDGSGRSTAETVTGTQSSTTSTSPLDLELTGDAIPEKFRGKKVKDALESYASLESRLGTMANELGVQRQLTDRLLDLKRNDDLRKNTPPAQREKPQVTASDILDKPAETLDRVLTQRDQTIAEEVNRRFASLEMSIAESQFKARHSDFQDVVNSSAFGDWVRSSPIRLRAAAAANQGNWQIADELLSEFKASGQTRQSGGSTTTTTTAATADLAGARKATLESSTGAGGSDGVKKGKTYSRADLMRLRIEDPEAYYDDAFQAEILQAYQEKRVK